MQDLQLIITGGTVDKTYCTKEQNFVMLGKSEIAGFIKKFVNPDTVIHEKVVAMLDSRDFTGQTREDIYKAIVASESSNIIVTHGTDTMVQTGRYLKSKNIVGKKIVLVGAFYPLVGFVPTDAPFNLGFAIGSLGSVKEGVYLAMNMKLFDPETVVKNHAKARFE